MHGSLVDALRAQVSQHPDRDALIFLAADGAATHFTYGQLDLDARRYAGLLRANDVQPGDLVIVAFEHGYELVAAFWGALYGGVVPTIVPYRDATGSGEARQRRLIALAAFTDARAVLCPSEAQAEAVGWLGGQATRALTLTEGTEPLAEALLSFRSGEEIAYIQFSSGTTGMGKGVILSHRAAANNICSAIAATGLEEQDVTVGWLPFYHDFGLMTGIFMPLLTGSLSVSMSPATWSRRPHLLFQAIDLYFGTFAWMPNFAFDHCLRSSRDEHLKGLDLSRLRTLGNGGEPVQPETLRRFSERLASWGLNPTALRVVYGMAENVGGVSITRQAHAAQIDFVSGSDLQNLRHALQVPPRQRGAKAIASCGKPFPGVAVRIVDDAGHLLSDRHVGEILVTGSSLFSGYLGDAEHTTQALRDGWFHTGDLGYLVDGELYVCGRLKDLIIVGGQNVYPESIEALAQEILGEQGRKVAAFGVMDDDLGTEVPVLVCDPRGSPSDEEQAQLAVQVRAQVLAELGVTLADVRFARGLVERTTSGKVARGATRERYLAAGYWPQPASVVLSPALLADPAALEGALLALARRVLGAVKLSPQDNLFDAGADSLTMVRMVLQVEDQLNVQVGTVFFGNPTIAYLITLLGPQTPPSAPAEFPLDRPQQAAYQPLTPPHGRFVRGGPTIRGHTPLPYGLGVALQRAWLAVPAIQRRFFDKEVTLLQRWGQRIETPPDADVILQNLLANTWRGWRNHTLTAPLGASPWVTVQGDATLWQAQAQPQGRIYLVMHTPLAHLFYHGLIAGGVKVLTLYGHTGEFELREYDRAAQVYLSHQALLRGEAVIIAGDGGKGRQHVVVPFFGGERPFLQGGAELAVQTGAALTPVFCTLATSGHVTIEVCPPLARGAGAAQAQIERLTRAYADLVVARWPQVFSSLTWENLARWLARTQPHADGG